MARKRAKIDLLFSRTATAAQGRREKASAKKAAPLAPNIIVAKALDKTLLTIGLGLVEFRPSTLPGPLPPGWERYRVRREDLSPGLCPDGHDFRSCIMESVGKNPRWELMHSKIYRELHILSDMGSTGVPAHLWLSSRAGLLCTWTTDMFAHDAVNSVKAAIVGAGLWVLVLEIGLTGNFLTGPFGSQQNFDEFTGAAADAFAFIEDICTEPWPRFFKAVAKDLGLWSRDAEGPALSHQVLQLAKTHPCLKNIGTRIKLSRWFSVFRVFRERLKPAWHIYLLVYLHAGAERGWFATQHDLRLFGDRDGLGTLTSSDLPAGAAVPRGVAASERILNSLRHKCENTSHLAATILANRLSHRLFCALEVFTNRSAAAHGKHMQAARDPAECLKTRVRLATGGALDEVLDIAAAAHDLQELEDARFIRMDEGLTTSIAEHEEEQRVCDYLHDFFCRLLGHRAVALSHLEYGLPWKYASLLSDDAEARQSALATFQHWWTCLQTLDQEALVNTMAKEFRTNLVFPTWGHTYYVLVTLWEADFQRVPPHLHNRLLRWARGFLSSEVTENGIRTVRNQAVVHDQQAMRRGMRWARLLESGILADHSRPMPSLTATDKQAGQGREVPAALFTACAGPYSIPVEEFETIRTERARYPKQTAAKYHEAGYRWASYCRAGSWNVLKGHWPSMLLRVGSLVSWGNGEAAVTGVVLYSCEHYCLLWRPLLVDAARGVYSWRSDHANKITMECLSTRDLPGATAQRLDGLSPWKFSRIHRGHFEFAMRTSGAAEPVARFASREAFLGMNTTWLERLYVFEKLPKPVPSNERGLLYALVKHFLPHLTDDEIEALRKTRETKPPKYESPLLDTENEDIILEGLDKDDVEDVQKGLAAARRGRTSNDDDGGEPDPAPDPPPMPSPGAAASSGTSAGPAEPHQPPPRPPDAPRREFESMDGEVPTLEWARTLLPPVGRCILHLDDTMSMRWRLTYRNDIRGGQKNFSKSFTTGMELTRLEALKVVLGIAWDIYTKETPGQACPFDISKLPAIVYV